MNPTRLFSFLSLNGVLTMLMVFLLSGCCGWTNYESTCYESQKKMEKVETKLTYRVDPLSWHRREGWGPFQRPAIEAKTRITNTSHLGGTFEIVVRFNSDLRENPITLKDSRYIAAGASAYPDWEHILQSYEQVSLASADIYAPTVSETVETIENIAVPCIKRCNTCDNPGCDSR